MNILISNASDLPLYQQIKDQIKDAILREELKEGDMLPSIRSFANDLKVSVLTIRRVYEELYRHLCLRREPGLAAGFPAAAGGRKDAGHDSHSEVPFHHKRRTDGNDGHFI